MGNEHTAESLSRLEVVPRPGQLKRELVALRVLIDRLDAVLVGSGEYERRLLARHITGQAGRTQIEIAARLDAYEGPVVQLFRQILEDPEVPYRELASIFDLLLERIAVGAGPRLHTVGLTLVELVPVVARAVAEIVFDRKVAGGRKIDAYTELAVWLVIDLAYAPEGVFK